MVGISSVTAEIRRGKKKKQDKNVMSASATQGGHNKVTLNFGLRPGSNTERTA